MARYMVKDGRKVRDKQKTDDVWSRVRTYFTGKFRTTAVITIITIADIATAIPHLPAIVLTVQRCGSAAGSGVNVGGGARR